MKRYLTIYFLLHLSIFTTCKGGDDDIIIEVSNLTIDIIIDDNNSGTVNVSAVADNAIEYEFYVGENDLVLSSLNGKATYTYSFTGLYNIEVRAIGESGRYLKNSKEIYVQVGEETGPIDTENGYITPLSYEGMSLIWQDEFNGNSLNESDWNYEIGTGSNGWGNNELQYYRKENTSIDDGVLVIEAKKEDYEGRMYTSSRLTTQGKFDFTYGRVDIRAQLPQGQGIWPALWMLGSNFSTVGWPKCGETDIMEMVGGGEGKDDTTYGTLHWDNNGNYACSCDQDNDFELTSGIFADKFHVFTIIWDANSIQWFVDDIHFKTSDITSVELDEFRKDFFFIFNVAVGGNWPGSPNAFTTFPQQMVVDYIRVFQTM